MMNEDSAHTIYSARVVSLDFGVEEHQLFDKWNLHLGRIFNFQQNEAIFSWSKMEKGQ